MACAKYSLLLAASESFNAMDAAAREAAIRERLEARKEAQRKAEEERLPLSPRWTKLDDRLAQYTGQLYPKVLDVSLQQRLHYLQQINLADKNGALYTLKPDWKEKLQSFGRYNTYMSEYLRENGNIRLYQGGLLEGTVEKTITFDKDESWNDAIIVRTSNGKVYVPVYNLQKDNLEGRIVHIEMPYFDTMKKIADKEIKIQRNGTKKPNIEGESLLGVAFLFRI